MNCHRLDSDLDAFQVHMTLASNRKRAGNGPCLIECYGAYGTNLDVSHNPFKAALMDRGWLIAFTHVRGGGEKGRRWHHAGRQSGKLSSLQV